MKSVYGTSKHAAHVNSVHGGLLRRSTKYSHASASTSPYNHARGNQKTQQADRALLLDVLSSNATKRDAKSYLSRFSPGLKGSKPHLDTTSSQPKINQVNLGTLYHPPEISRTEPLYTESQILERDSMLSRNVRTAIVVVRSISAIDRATLAGISHTLAQVSRLGLNCVIILDNDSESHGVTSKDFYEQSERLIDAIDADDVVRAKRFDRVFNMEHSSTTTPYREPAVSSRVDKIGQMYYALSKGLIVVLTPAIYGGSGDIVEYDANKASLSLAKALKKFSTRNIDKSIGEANSLGISEGSISVDRLIIIDPQGGIPNIRLGGSHVFLNLEQDHEEVTKELQELLIKDWNSKSTKTRSEGSKSQGKLSAEKPLVSVAAATMSAGDIKAHEKNISLARGILAVLPSTSSALIATPSAAAFDTNTPLEGVATRSPRNPLIHNLLTDKPFFSSSLPRGRLSASDTTGIPTNHPSLFHAPPTYLKHGVPVIVTPDPLKDPWQPPRDVTFSLSLDDPRIDKSRLVNLIEDSFGRKLDTEDYFKRIRKCLAGIIVAGDYEGGAVLTWEQPRSHSPHSSTQGHHIRLVPYLDKFAVLRGSQGGGVADVVFSAMVRRCFPHGVCWRSRNGNPVNKWYFERSRGAFKLPVQEGWEQAWTMFWTTEGLQSERFVEYAEVCQAIKGSWADGKKVLD